MKIPDVDIPIKPVYFPWEVVMKAERSAEKVQERMYRAAEALQREGVPFVVIGGNAVAIWVATRDEDAIRYTKDVDILLARTSLKSAEIAMSRAGFDLAEVNGVTMFLDQTDPMPSRGVHILFAEERIRAHDTVAAPAVRIGTVSKAGVPAVDLPELLTLKLIAYRRVDQVHIADLIKVGLVDDAMAAQIPAELWPRLEEIRANPDG